MSFLQKIIDEKKREIEVTFQNFSASLKKVPTDTKKPHNVESIMRNKKFFFITEIKKASPSKGIIRQDFQPLLLSKELEDGGSDCLSILTEKKYFQGNLGFISSIKKICSLPILRKDFIIDARQIRESYEAGADLILLIAACLQPNELKYFKECIESFGMHCLVEIHNQQEWEKIQPFNFSIIGINNRNLTTFETKIENSINLVKYLPQHSIKISESGIKTAEDCKILYDNGFHGVLIGEILMNASTPKITIQNLQRNFTKLVEQQY